MNKVLSIKRGLFILSALFLSTGFFFDDEVVEDGIQVKHASNLQQLARQASQTQRAILLEFSAESCPYCVTLEEEILKPMIRSGDYQNKILIRKLNIDQYQSVIDFNGNKVSPSELASRYKVWVTPTVVLLDSQGREIAARQVGINSIDYYGAYLDDEIEVAIAKLQTKPEAKK